MDTLGNPFDTLLTRGALGALVLAAAWSVSVLVAIGVEARTHGRLRWAGRLGCPDAVRLPVLAGFLVLFAAVSPAQASDTGPGHGAGPVVSVDGLPLPDRLSGPAHPAPVVVRPGDSLWRIARRLLPADATDQRVAALVDALHAANRRLIGPDPDRLRPGQRLRLDALETSTRPLIDTTTEAP